MNKSGNILMVINGFHFRKTVVRKNRSYWFCADKPKYKCKARVIQDTLYNKFKPFDHIVHNHENERTLAD